VLVRKKAQISTNSVGAWLERFQRRGSAQGGSVSSEPADANEATGEVAQTKAKGQRFQEWFAPQLANDELRPGTNDKVVDRGKAAEKSRHGIDRRFMVGRREWVFVWRECSRKFVPAADCAHAEAMGCIRALAERK